MGAWNAILPLVFLLIGQANPEFVKIAKNSTPTSYEVQYAETVSFPRDSLFSVKKLFTQVFTHEGKEVLGIANWNRNAIRIFDLNTGENLKEVNFDPYKFGRIRTFYVINEDSLLLFSRASEKDRLILSDLKAGRMEEIAYDNWVKWDPQNLAEMESVDCLAFQPVQFSQGKIFLGLLPYDKLNHHPTNKREYTASIDLKHSEFFRYPLYHPEVYYQSDYTYVYDLVQTEVAGEKLIFSFNGVPQFYVYNLKSGEVATHHSSSKYFDLQQPPVQIQGKSQSELLMEHGSYGRILHDPHRKLYYRILHPPTPLFDEETGMFRTLAERKTSILVMNEKFEAIGESRIFEGFRQNSMGVSSEGLLILDLKATEESNKSVIFAVINLQAKK